MPALEPACQNGIASFARELVEEMCLPRTCLFCKAACDYARTKKFRPRRNRRGKINQKAAGDVDYLPGPGLEYITQITQITQHSQSSPMATPKQKFRSSQRKPSFRPNVEPLEDRIATATYTVNDPGDAPMHNLMDKTAMTQAGTVALPGPPLSRRITTVAAPSYSPPP